MGVGGHRRESLEHFSGSQHIGMEPAVPLTLTICRHGLHGFLLPSFGPCELLRICVSASVLFQEPLHVSWRQACAMYTWNHPRVGWHTHISAAFLPPQSQPGPTFHKERHPSSGQDPRPTLPTTPANFQHPCGFGGTRRPRKPFP